MRGPSDCELCHSRQARYVCQECGRKTCEQCINPWDWTCLGCKPVSKGREKAVETYSSEDFLGKLFPKLLTLGFLMIFAGMALVFLTAVWGGTVQGGSGFFFIWPFPFIFGFGSGNVQSFNLSAILAVAAFFTATLLAVFLWFSRRLRYI